MGKASRMKKGRKEQSSANIGTLPKLPSKASMKVVGQTAGTASSPSVAFPNQLKGSNLIVIDGNGHAHREQESRQIYWGTVCDAIEERGASCLPDMVALGALMSFSIFDVKVPIMNCSTGVKYQEDIFMATFLLEYVDCFQWLLQEAKTKRCDIRLVGRLFQDVVSDIADIQIGSPKMAMATMLVKFMVELLYVKGMLDKAMNDGQSLIGQPFIREIAADFLAEVAAKKERADLEAQITDPIGAAEPDIDAIESAGAAIKRARADSRSLRI